MVLNVALSEPMQAFIEEQIATGKYSNASEYIYYLVEQEQERLAREQVEAMLLEGLESGEAIEVTDEWWQQKRDRLIQQSTHKNQRQRELSLLQKRDALLWKFMKYEWIEVGAYKDWGNLVGYVKKVLSQVGNKYVINFA